MERRTLNRERSQKGFTAMELIIVIMVLSVLAAAVIIKNPFSIQDYSSIAKDQLIADIRFVQLKAMGAKSSQAIKFFVDGSDYGKYSVAGVEKKLPGTITVTNIGTIVNPLTFNSLGEPTSSGVIQLSGGYGITVYASTGKAE